MAKEVEGRWSDVINLQTVAVHASLLHTGQVLYWGRRGNPKSPFLIDHNLDQHFTQAFVWDPKTLTSEPITKVIGPNNTQNWPVSISDGRRPINHFCSGHCFLPDGKLLVAGGHIIDGQGIREASLYDPTTKKFIPQQLMYRGRWYPSCLTLPDGRVLVISGNDSPTQDLSGQNFAAVSNIPQIWSPSSDSSKPELNTWTEVKDSYTQIELKDKTKALPILPLYPRIHLTPKGRIFVAGTQAESLFLDIKDDKGFDIKDAKGVVGTWSDAKAARKAGFSDYAPSVSYEPGKIIYMGGGTAAEDNVAVATTEIIDLNEDNPQWKPAASMLSGRKQFNATVLADGTVLVTGGFSGKGFNDLGTAVTRAELWDPATNKWTWMATEKFPRCYHGTALLLKDGRVFSGGNGEYGGVTIDQCTTEAQLFEPPYLFKQGVRPTIVNVQAEIKYGTTFPVTVGTNDVIKKSFIWLVKDNKQTGPKLDVPAPANENLAPPGYYMLFVLNDKGAPSVAEMVHLPTPPAKTTTTAAPSAIIKPSSRVADIAQSSVKMVQPTLSEHDERIKAEQTRPPVVVGITPLCPYGLGPCWAGAHDALHDVKDIDVVRPMPDNVNSLAFVYLKEDVLPDIDVWRSEFAKTVNHSYTMRGIEMTLSGTVAKKQSGSSEHLVLTGTSTRPELVLAPFQATSQIKWDIRKGAPQMVHPNDIDAYERLSAALKDHAEGAEVQVTGTLQKHGNNNFSLDVRDFKV